MVKLQFLQRSGVLVIEFFFEIFFQKPGIYFIKAQKIIFIVIIYRLDKILNLTISVELFEIVMMIISCTEVKGEYGRI